MWPGTRQSRSHPSPAGALKIIAKVEVAESSGFWGFFHSLPVALFISPAQPRGLIKPRSVAGSRLSAERIKWRSNSRIPWLPLRLIVSQISL